MGPGPHPRGHAHAGGPGAEPAAHAGGRGRPAGAAHQPGGPGRHRGGGHAGLRRAGPEAGARALVLKGSVADPQQVREMFRRLLSEFGRIDILVNNAGVLRPGF
ncbi:SDR family NAD(P)-dependent oxidoreductase, partial [Symbiobacterium terraclitae]|uniref:SDR family NAD(P)-dependent oxidoreductase n=1 Tax=Symbiobacterium terraclitae TaxID=557451 RepID=UPI0035B4FC92